MSWHFFKKIDPMEEWQKYEEQHAGGTGEYAGISLPELTFAYYNKQNEAEIALLRARTEQEVRELKEQALLTGIRKEQAGIQKEQAGLQQKQAGLQAEQAQLQRTEAERALIYDIGAIERQGERALGVSQVSAAARGVRGASQEAIETEILTETERVTGRRRETGETAIESARLAGEAAGLAGTSAGLQAKTAGLQADIYGRQEAGYLQKAGFAAEYGETQAGLLTDIGVLRSSMALKSALKAEAGEPVSFWDFAGLALDVFSLL